MTPTAEQALEALRDIAEGSIPRGAADLLRRHIESTAAEVEALRDDAATAALERDRYRNGNTTLLELLMSLHAGNDIVDTVERSREILRETGLMDEAGGLNWQALEARKPKPKTWEQAVRECVTDPAEVERLLALDDKAVDAALNQGGK